MGDPLGYRTERPQSVQAAAADDKQVGVRRSGEERGDWFVRHLLGPVANCPVEEFWVDALTAVGDDGPQARCRSGQPVDAPLCMPPPTPENRRHRRRSCSGSLRPRFVSV